MSNEIQYLLSDLESAHANVIRSITPFSEKNETKKSQKSLTTGIIEASLELPCGTT